jgi:hypothetical protein
MTISENQIITLLTVCATMLTAAVGLLGYFVGRQQAKTERLRLRHELYDRRMKIFRATMELLVHVVRKSNINLPELLEFNAATNESYFLFGREIYDYLFELHCKAADLDSAHVQLHDSNPVLGEERGKVIKDKTELVKWFGKQFDIAREKFAQHMSLHE